MHTNRYFPLAALLLFVPASGFSQAAPPGAPVAANDQTVEMSPFDVNATPTQGYATTSASSASRIAVPITDLPSDVIVINEKLIEDLGAVTMPETLNLVGGVSANAQAQAQQQNKFSMRGFTQTTAERDGFQDLLYGVSGGFSYTFIDRVEVLKGPDGILYGNNNPGGVINLVSKLPTEEPHGNFDLMAGSHRFYQVDLDTSSFFDAGHQWGFRVAASEMNSNGPLDHPADVNKKPFFALNPSVSFKTKNGFTFWIWTGFVDDQSPRLNRIAHMFVTSLPTANGAGSGEVLKNMGDYGGAHGILTNLARVSTEDYEGGVTKSVQLFGNLRLDLRGLFRITDQLNSSTLVNATGGLDIFVNKAGAILGTDDRNVPYSVVNGNLGGVYRSVGVQLTGTNTYYKGWTYATDAALTFETGPVKNNLLVFSEYDELTTTADPGYAGHTFLVSSLANLTKIGADISGTTARIWEYPMSRENLAGVSAATVIADANTISAATNSFAQNDEYSAGGVERASFFDQRVFLVGGLRYTNFPSTNQTGTAAPIYTSDVSWQTNYGILVKVLKGRWGEGSLYFNHSETFVPDFTIDKRLATLGQKLPDNTVNTPREIGVKFDTLDSRVVLTAATYRMNETDVLIPETDVTGAITGVTNGSYNVPGGTESIWGWDVDLSANLARGLDTIFSAGETTVHMNSLGGQPAIGQPTNTIAALARYEVPTGALKNFSLAWNFTYWGKSMLNSRDYWLLPPGYNHVAILGYHWKNYSVKVRVDDVFNHISVLPGLNETNIVLTDHRNFRFILGAKF